MTPQEFIGVATITLDEVRRAAKRGADNERRRIRRKQKGWIGVVEGFIATVPVTSAANAIALGALRRIDDATRGGKERGR